MFQVYCKLLHQLSTDESYWISSSFINIPSEHERILTEANATKVAFEDKDLLLHELFDKTATTNETAVAVLTPAKSLSYKEVRSRALSLAAQLKNLRVEPNQLVAIVMQKVMANFICYLYN
jgi:non-ribosomal peptide synthetase component F